MKTLSTLLLLILLGKSSENAGSFAQTRKLLPKRMQFVRKVAPLQAIDDIMEMDSSLIDEEYSLSDISRHYKDLKLNQLQKGDCLIFYGIKL